MLMMTKTNPVPADETGSELKQTLTPSQAKALKERILLILKREWGENGFVQDLLDTFAGGAFGNELQDIKESTGEGSPTLHTFMTRRQRVIQKYRDLVVDDVVVLTTDLVNLRLSCIKLWEDIGQKARPDVFVQERRILAQQYISRHDAEILTLTNGGEILELNDMEAELIKCQAKLISISQAHDVTMARSDAETQLKKLTQQIDQCKDHDNTLILKLEAAKRAVERILEIHARIYVLTHQTQADANIQPENGLVHNTK